MTVKAKAKRPDDARPSIKKSPSEGQRGTMSAYSSRIVENWVCRYYSAPLELRSESMGTSTSQKLPRSIFTFANEDVGCGSAQLATKGSLCVMAGQGVVYQIYYLTLLLPPETFVQAIQKEDPTLETIADMLLEERGDK